MDIPPLPAHAHGTILTIAGGAAAITWLLTLCAELAGYPMNWADHLGASVFGGSLAYICATLFLTWRNRQHA